MSVKKSPPLVSLIIVCHNDGKWLPRCLQSIRTQTIFDRCEIIIADNASEDGSDKLANDLIAGWPNARFFPTGGDNGFDVACNRAANQASGKYLYLLNPDTWLEKDCLEQLYLCLETRPAAAAGGTILEYEDDTIQARGGEGFDLFGNPVCPKINQTPNELFCISGFFFIRRDTFLRLGMLDEKLFMYGEEADLSWRIWISGESVAAAPKARIHHRGAAVVNPAGGATQVENRTSIQKRFLANRNRLMTIGKNCQNLLLPMFLACAGLLLLEGLIVLVKTRSWSIANASCFKALAACWQMRAHIREQRQQIAKFRRRNDLWMSRFIRLRFGRWGEVQKILRLGFPKFR
jgi:GT2 family glycosyltransferase